MVKNLKILDSAEQLVSTTRWRSIRSPRHLVANAQQLNGRSYSERSTCSTPVVVHVGKSLYH